MPGMGAKTAQRAPGHTLPELLIAVAITALLAILALGSFSSWQESQKLIDTADRYRLRLQHARQVAMARQMPVRLQFTQTAEGSCYRMVTTAAPDCQCTTTSCVGEGVIAQEFLPADQGLHIAPTGAVTEVHIDPTLGTFQPTVSATFSLPDGRAIRQITNLMGRTRSCSLNGWWPGLPSC